MPKTQYNFSEEQQKELLGFLDNLLHDAYKIKFPLHQPLTPEVYLSKVQEAENIQSLINETFLPVIREKAKKDCYTSTEEKKRVVFKFTPEQVAQVAEELNLSYLKIEQLVLPTDFSNEGSKMRHCIASYSLMETALFFSIALTEKDTSTVTRSTLMISILGTVAERHSEAYAKKPTTIFSRDGTATVTISRSPFITQHYFEENKQIPTTSCHRFVARFLLEKVINWWFKDSYALVKIG